MCDHYIYGTVYKYYTILRYCDKILKRMAAFHIQMASEHCSRPIDLFISRRRRRRLLFWLRLMRRCRWRQQQQLQLMLQNPADATTLARLPSFSFASSAFRTDWLISPLPPHARSKKFGLLVGGGGPRFTPHSACPP